MFSTRQLACRLGRNLISSHHAPPSLETRRSRRKMHLQAEACVVLGARPSTMPFPRCWQEGQMRNYSGITRDLPLFKRQPILHERCYVDRAINIQTRSYAKLLLCVCGSVTLVTARRRVRRVYWWKMPHLGELGTPNHCGGSMEYVGDFWG